MTTVIATAILSMNLNKFGRDKQFYVFRGETSLAFHLLVPALVLVLVLVRYLALALVDKIFAVFL